MTKFILGTAMVVLTQFIITASFAQTSTKDSSTNFKVFGECIQCKQRIEKALKIKGINSASWDIASEMLAVSYDPSIIPLNEIHSKIAEVGHDTQLKKATDKAYNALPACCHYRELRKEENNPETDKKDIDQDNIRGVVLSVDNKGNFIPLSGASIIWSGSQQGTKTDLHGVFSLPFQQAGDKLVVSYVGYHSDSITVRDKNDLQIVLASNGYLKEVRVISTQRSRYTNFQEPIRTTTITSRELLKAACCNLSESFETNPSVDVSYSDAVTGSKQIQLLGLAGIYTQLTVENLPGPRGLATPLGLNSIAGPWIESIQLSKGTGSVANGFESIAGQINVELKKPESSEKLYVNGYVNSMGKTDVNLNLSHKISGKWSTGILLHDDFLYNKTDFNKDGFRDLPTGNLFSAINRWKYDNNKGFMLQFGAKALIDDRTGGQTDFSEKDKLTTNSYGAGIKTNRYEGFAKIGYVFPEKKYKSIGLQLSGFSHQQDAYFGLNTYNGKQNNFYSNLIYQDIIGTTAHKFRTGLSFESDNYNEFYKNQPYKRNESVPGAFFEYTYTMNEKFNLVAGVRVDHNSLFGWFATPRLNLRFEPVKGTVIRVGGGRGQRTANIFAENMGVLVSSRVINIITTSNDKAYGLDPEIAWNKGISIDQKFRLFNKDAMLNVDFYRNDFTNQVVVDLEDPRQVKFYNLEGQSYSNSFQAEWSVTPVKNFDVRMAYRWFDVKTTYSGQLLEKPFTAKNRAFINLAYEWQNWKFDYTVNYVGKKRIPSTIANPAPYQMPETSPDYFTMNAQVSRAFGKNKMFEAYIGVENITNYFQHNAIIAANQPFGNYFDASMIWGPVYGRTVYGGFRYKIK